MAQGPACAARYDASLCHIKIMMSRRRMPGYSPQSIIMVFIYSIVTHSVTSELRQMRQKQDQEKRDLVESQRSMSSIEAAAQRQYQADLKAAEESQKQRLGEWVSMQFEFRTIFCTSQLCYCVVDKKTNDSVW